PQDRRQRLLRVVNLELRNGMRPGLAILELADEQQPGNVPGCHAVQQATTHGFGFATRFGNVIEMRVIRRVVVVHSILLPLAWLTRPPSTCRPWPRRRVALR